MCILKFGQTNVKLIQYYVYWGIREVFVLKFSFPVQKFQCWATRIPRNANHFVRILEISQKRSNYAFGLFPGILEEPWKFLKVPEKPLIFEIIPGNSVEVLSSILFLKIGQPWPSTLTLLAKTETVVRINFNCTAV